MPADGQDGGAVVSTVSTQQEGSGLVFWLGPLCVESASSHCLCAGSPASSYAQDIHIWLIYYSELPVDVCVVCL